MKVGILGSGDVAKVLAGGFLKHGHEVMIGTRTPEKLAEWASSNAKAATGTFADAAQFGELIGRSRGAGRARSWPGSHDCHAARRPRRPLCAAAFQSGLVAREGS